MSKPSKPRQQTGMTLIELIVAIVIIAVGLAGVLSVFNTNVRASADPMVQKQLLAIAEGMMDEVALLPFAPGTPNWTGAHTCSERHNFDDVSDFDDYTNQPVCDMEGTAIASLSGYTVNITVDDALLGMEIAPEQSKKITVTVSRNSNESVTLIGWRTNWAKQ